MNEIKSVKLGDFKIIGHGMLLLTPESKINIEFNDGTNLLITAQSGIINRCETFDHKGDLFLRITTKDIYFFDIQRFESNDGTDVDVFLEVFKRTKELIAVSYSILIDKD